MASAMGEWRAWKAPAGGGRRRRRDLSPRAGALSTWRWSHGSRHGLFSAALPGCNGVSKYSLRVDLLDFRPIPQSPPLLRRPPHRLLRDSRAGGPRSEPRSRVRNAKVGIPATLQIEARRAAGPFRQVGVRNARVGIPRCSKSKLVERQSIAHGVSHGGMARAESPGRGGRRRRSDLSPRAGALSTWRWSHGLRHGLFSVALPGWNGVCKYSLRVDLLDFRPIPQSPHFCVAHPASTGCATREWEFPRCSESKLVERQERSAWWG